uniref:Uncharacterized protein n=1 Tax=Aegilops tauschii TaxID=37682 RepID=M8BP89_AEGTA
MANGALTKKQQCVQTTKSRLMFKLKGIIKTIPHSNHWNFATSVSAIMTTARLNCHLSDYPLFCFMFLQKSLHMNSKLQLSDILQFDASMWPTNVWSIHMPRGVHLLLQRSPHVLAFRHPSLPTKPLHQHAISHTISLKTLLLSQNPQLVCIRSPPSFTKCLQDRVTRYGIWYNPLLNHPSHQPAHIIQLPCLHQAIQNRYASRDTQSSNRQADPKLQHLMSNLKPFLVPSFSEEPAHKSIEAHTSRCTAPALHLLEPPHGGINAFHAAGAVDEYVEGVGIRCDAVDTGHLAVEADGVVVAVETGESVENDVVELGGEGRVRGAPEGREGFGRRGDVAGGGEGEDGLAEGREEIGAGEDGVVGAGAGAGEDELEEAPQRGEAAGGREARGEEAREAVVGAEGRGGVGGREEEMEVERREAREVRLGIWLEVLSCLENHHATKNLEAMTPIDRPD